MADVKYAANDVSMLPAPPWKPEQVSDWEAAHGHDVRLGCDIRTCNVVVADYEAAVDALAAMIDHHDTTTNHDECLALWDARAAFQAARRKSKATR